MFGPSQFQRYGEDALQIEKSREENSKVSDRLFRQDRRAVTQKGQTGTQKQRS